MNERVCAIVPAFNEARHIGALLEGIKKRLEHIIVINDGSTDLTASIAVSKNVRVIQNTSNKGKGNALRQGFDLALKDGYEYIITIDADGQHDPEEVPRFIDRISSAGEGTGLVSGNRMTDIEDMPPQRIFFNKLSSKIVSRLCGQSIPDALCGYRIISARALRSIDLSCNRFDIVPEILISMSDIGSNIHSIDIKTLYADEKSHIRPLRDAYMFCRLIFRKKYQRWIKKQRS